MYIFPYFCTQDSGYVNCPITIKVVLYEVTIGIPVYQAVDYIAKTMESALCQTFSAIEFLVVDDAGCDGTMDVIERLKSEHSRGKDIRILRNQKTLGVGTSRNRIISEAQGRYLYFLDSDDTIEPDTIELLVDAVQQHQADVVYASYEKIDTIHHAPTETFQYARQFFEGQDTFAVHVFSHYSRFQVSVCNCLMDIDFLKRNKLKFIDAMFWEDMAFTYDMATKVERAVLLPSITYHYQCRPYSLSNYQDRDILNRDEILRNASTIDYLKWRCYKLRAKPYAPDFNYVLQVNSFYIVRHVLRYRDRIRPQIYTRELRQVMHSPLRLRYILQFKYKRILNLLLWLIPHLPIPLFLLVVYVISKVKNIIR